MGSNLVRSRASVSFVLVAAGALTVAVFAACSSATEVTPDEALVLTATPTDGKKSGDETDVDCGGTRAAKCADGKKCSVGGDCANAVCAAGTCTLPSPTDGAKNADETDVDCGGTKAPKCPPTKGCSTNGDCASDACSYDKKCVTAKGCTAHFGGDTCGAGEAGAPDEKHESCCTVIDIAEQGAPGGGFKMDKYHVTAGRMRAFAERYQGNLKTWASEKPKGWDESLTDSLPETMEDVNALLGPNGKRGCSVKEQGGRTFFQAPVGGDSAERSDFSKDVLDEKALNCVPWNLAAAVCSFDGGHLASSAEIQWVFRNGSKKTNYPWQFADTTPYNPAMQDERVVHMFSYATPNPPNDMRLVGSGDSAYPLDHAFYIARPGSRPKGANVHGIQDAAGNLMPWVRDKDRAFSWTQSWEKHEKKPTTSNWVDQAAETPDGYYGIGVRCTY